MKKLFAVALCAATALQAAFAQQQVVTPPRATVHVSATSHSGIPGMGGGAVDPMAMMRALGGGGAAPVSRSLLLELGSMTPGGDRPRTEQLIPPTLRIGTSLPFKVFTRPPETPGERAELENPRGRILVYWGCGERVGSGQPMVFDFRNLRAGQVPPDFAALSTPVADEPSLWRRAWTTRASWPNDIDRRTPPVPADASLVGAHTVRGPWVPTMNFTLAPEGDYLAPFEMRESRAASGAKTLSWTPIARATGYALSAIGPRGTDPDEDNPELVVWSSSAVRAFMPSVASFLEPDTVRRLIASRHALAPSVSSCTIPREVVEAMPMGMVIATAWGPVSNFVHPPRPADPRTPWTQEWSAKVRTNAMWTGFVGENPMAMASGEAAGRTRECPPPRRSTAERVGEASGIPGGGLLGRALGGLGGGSRQQPQPQADPDCP
jgi:hypothetical protein